MRDKLPTTIVRFAKVVGLALAYTDGELGLRLSARCGETPPHHHQRHQNHSS